LFNVILIIHIQIKVADQITLNNLAVPYDF
jgi:hypothetical protein